MDEPTVDARGAALVTKIGAKKNDDGDITGWLVKAMLSSSDFPGFISAEILPPETHQSWEWTLVQRFRDSTQIESSKKTESQIKFLAEMQAACAANDWQIKQEEHSYYGARGSVTTAIVTHVIPGMESEYRQWESRVQTAQAKFAGYKGSYLQPPTGGVSDMWITLLRFETPESLDRWFGSAERLALLGEVQKLVKSTDIRRDTGSFPGWFPIDEKTGKGPPNWKSFLLVLLGLYPIVMLEIRFLMPALSYIPSAPVNLIGNSISVALTTWVTMPIFIKCFNSWLFPAGKQSVVDNLKWVAILLVLFAIEVGLLWNLLSPPS